jgi:hypothetical protein
MGLTGPVRSRALDRCLACEADRSETEPHGTTMGGCSRRHSSLPPVARHLSDIYGTHKSHQSQSSPCRNRGITQQRVSCHRPNAKRIPYFASLYFRFPLFTLATSKLIPANQQRQTTGKTGT